MFKLKIFLLAIIAMSTTSWTQSNVLTGHILAGDEPASFAEVSIIELEKQTTTDETGKYRFHDLPEGEYTLHTQYIGFNPNQSTVQLTGSIRNYELDIQLELAPFLIDQVVITGTKTFKRQTQSPIIVNVLNDKTLSDVQACNLSESLNFQPGLRVETDCQTCNYTQLRMNGLSGGYSQILVNGRPIFSPLTGLYGLDQLPVNMIDRIEVIRGCGSSLYGSSAIGGTVNVITKIPTRNNYELDYNYHSISSRTPDHRVSGRATVVNTKQDAGISFFINQRNRAFYDANGDNFSEIPLLNSTAIGTSFFLRPNEDQKLAISISKISEYRLGGEMLPEMPPHLTQQSEERNHDVWMSNLDYQINFNEGNSSLSTYAGLLSTRRKHFTGIQPDEGTTAYEDYYKSPPYGHSDATTLNMGIQLNHHFGNDLIGKQTLTLGSEYIQDAVKDDIVAYNYQVDQDTRTFGTFVQSDWEITSKFNLLSGIRLDLHSLVEKPVISPRVAMLYKAGERTQIRLSYGTGFRAPQAFDADLHIAFAGGGVSRVVLSPDLKPEKSRSISGSVNYDKVTEKWIAGFTVEGFYTHLTEAFFLNPIGVDNFGEVFIKENGAGATVQGLTLELRANFDRKIQLESGLTLQSSLFDSPVSYIHEVLPIRDFVRTPDYYGYGIMTLTPDELWKIILNYNLTGTMIVPHFAGAPNQSKDELFSSPSFSDLGFKISRIIPVPHYEMKYELYVGAKNILNAYQSDFDIGKNRDSNYIYGPAQPRTIYIGIKVNAL